MRLLKLAFLSSKKPIQEISFDGATDAEGGYVTISPERLAAMREAFLNARATKGPRDKERTATSATDGTSASSARRPRSTRRTCRRA